MMISWSFDCPMCSYNFFFWEGSYSGQKVEESVSHVNSSELKQAIHHIVDHDHYIPSKFMLLQHSFKASSALSFSAEYDHAGAWSNIWAWNSIRKYEIFIKILGLQA